MASLSGWRSSAGTAIGASAALAARRAGVSTSPGGTRIRRRWRWRRAGRRRAVGGSRRGRRRRARTRSSSGRRPPVDGPRRAGSCSRTLHVTDVGSTKARCARPPARIPVSSAATRSAARRPAARRGRPPSCSRAQPGSSRRPPRRRRATSARPRARRRSAPGPWRSGPTRTTVAVTSHLPHVLANVLLNQAGATRIDGHDPLQAAGGSLCAT